MMAMDENQDKPVGGGRGKVHGNTRKREVKPPDSDRRKSSSVGPIFHALSGGIKALTLSIPLATTGAIIIIIMMTENGPKIYLFHKPFGSVTQIVATRTRKSEPVLDRRNVLEYKLVEEWAGAFLHSIFNHLGPEYGKDSRCCSIKKALSLVPCMCVLFVTVAAG